MRARITPVARDVGVRAGAQHQVRAQERAELRIRGQVAGRVCAQQSDERLGDDPAADRTEVQAVRRDLGFGQGVVLQRGTCRERRIHGADIRKIGR